jgi:integrase
LRSKSGTSSGVADLPAELVLRLDPHRLRHTKATLALELDAPLERIQDELGHRDLRTTQKTNRARCKLDGAPAYTVAAALHDAT